MFHDYTLIKLAKARVCELLTEKRANELIKCRPQGSRYQRTKKVRTDASLRKSPDAAGACR